MHGHLARRARSFAMIVGFLCADWLGVVAPTTAQEMPPISTVEANGTQLTYVEQGQGTPVVFVHGTLTDYRLWTPQLEPFAQAGYQIGRAHV
jgi:hypothetical protein